MKKKIVKALSLLLTSVMLASSIDISALAADGVTNENSVSENQTEEATESEYLVENELVEDLSFDENADYMDDESCDAEDNNEELVQSESSEGYGITGPRKNPEGVMVWDRVMFGHDSQGRPLAWRVLDVNGNDAFLLADRYAEYISYDEVFSYSVSWKTSTIRSWLNGYGSSENASEQDYSAKNMNFIDTAFNSEEKAAIRNTTLTNGGSTGDNTVDKVFLLSSDDISKVSYGFNENLNEADENRVRVQYDRIYYIEYNWLLRSLISSSKPMYVDTKGVVHETDGSFYVDTKAYAVPALHLDLSQNVWAPAGVADAKYDYGYIILNDDSEKTYLPIKTGEYIYQKLPTLKKEGYIFTGWYKDKDFKSVADSISLPSYDRNWVGQNAYAGWEAIGESDIVEEQSIETTLPDGTKGTLTWKVDNTGCLIISGEGDFKRERVFSIGAFVDRTPWRNLDDKTIRKISSAKIDYKKFKDASSLFSGFSNMTEIDLSGFDTSDVTTMSSMFSGCSALESVDISKFNTANVTDMSYLFSGCRNLKSLDLNLFKTSNVTTMSSMFSGCRNLKSLDLNSFDTSNVTNMSYMFSDCVSLTKLDLSKYTSSEKNELPLDISGIYSNCRSLADPEAGYLYANRKISNMSKMFKDCSSMKAINLAGLDISEIKSMEAMFSGCTSLDSLTLADKPATKVTNLNDMFKDCKSLGSVDLSMFSGCKITSLEGMFQNCKVLSDINFGGLDTSGVTDMDYLFAGCKALKNLDLNSLDTRNVRSMEYMFNDAVAETIDLSKINTESLTSSAYMFKNCEADNISFGDFGSPKLTRMRYMFQSANIRELNLSGFDTSGATDMNGMFNDSKVETVNLSSFDTSNVTDMDFMFYGCVKVKNLDLSSFNTSKIRSLDYMFGECHSLKNIDLSSFDTSNVTSMLFAFDNCPMLEYLDLSGFDLSNLKSGTKFTNMTNVRRIMAPLHLKVPIAAYNTTIGVDGGGEYEWTMENGEKTKIFPQNLEKSVLIYIGENAEPIYSLGLYTTLLNLEEGQTYTIKAHSTLPSGVNDTITWSSSDKNIATVDSTGKVTAVSEGRAVITATAGDYSARCHVNVKGIDDGIVRYTVTFNGNGGTSDRAYMKIKAGAKYGTLPTASRDGYIFDGWYTESVGGKRIQSDMIFDQTSDQILYAHWITAHTVSFNGNGGVASVASIVVGEGKTYGTLPVATWEGKCFQGWFTEALAGVKVQSTDTVTIGTDITLYAHWADSHGTGVVRDVVEQTCEKAGYTGNTYCSVCNEKIGTGTAKPALGHEYEKEWTVTKPATFRAEGVKAVKCIRCDSTKTEPIPKLIEDGKGIENTSIVKNDDGTVTTVEEHTDKTVTERTELELTVGESANQKVELVIDKDAVGKTTYIEVKVETKDKAEFTPELVKAAKEMVGDKTNTSIKKVNPDITLVTKDAAGNEYTITATAKDLKKNAKLSVFAIDPAMREIILTDADKVKCDKKGGLEAPALTGDKDYKLLSTKNANKVLKAIKKSFALAEKTGKADAGASYTIKLADGFNPANLKEDIEYSMSSKKGTVDKATGVVTLNSSVKKGSVSVKVTVILMDGSKVKLTQKIKINK